MQENYKMQGYFKIEIIDAYTNKLIKTMFVKNQLTQANVEYRKAMLDGTYMAKNYNIQDLHIKYFALGTGTNTATASDTRLQTETLRKAVTFLNSSGNDVTSITVFSTNEANFRIREIGVFAGDDATDTANSGLMLARVNVDVDKNSSIVLNIQRIDRSVI